ncbi:MAG: hypothetical protein JNM80_09480 [Phycisphaerae bacterium]|nr:hypothetical protein [Phycisphaerae bacterium]
MGTPRSSDAWRVVALVFSGREDPCWDAPRELIDAVLAGWDRAAPASAAAPPPPLGYRGCVLRAPDGRAYTAFASTITLTLPGARAQTRGDPDRTIERLLLGSAPPGAIPPGVVPNLR